jgi:GNAT superfamily N-acetyltransferase
MTTQIRKARLADSGAILELAKHFATSFVVEEQAFTNGLSEILASPEAYLAVAENSQQIVGYVLGFDHFTFFANGRVAWVEEIMVRESFRRQNVGQMLMQEFEVWAAARKSKLVALATRRASAFYQAIGYEESATYFRKLL